MVPACACLTLEPSLRGVTPPTPCHITSHPVSHPLRITSHHTPYHITSHPPRITPHHTQYHITPPPPRITPHHIPYHITSHPPRITPTPYLHHTTPPAFQHHAAAEGGIVFVTTVSEVCVIRPQRACMLAPFLALACAHPATIYSHRPPPLPYSPAPSCSPTHTHIQTHLDRS